MASNSRTDEQEWVDRRVAAVSERHSVYDVLTEAGVELVDQSTSQSIFCPYPDHDNKNTMAARYYASSGRNGAHVWCYKCRVRTGTVDLYAKIKGLRFMEALSALERRFSISVPRRPESVFKPHVDRGAGYESETWSDVPAVVTVLEGKLSRIKGMCSMHEYVRFCRLIDAVQWDFDILGSSTPDMLSALMKTADMMNDVMSRENAAIT